MTIATSARMLLRDFPLFFENTLVAPINSRVRLAPLLASDPAHALQIVTAASSTPVTSGYQVDYRNGVLAWSADPGQSLRLSGYHYTWFLDEDLDFFADFQLQEHLRGTHYETEGDLGDLETNVIAMGTVVYALWSLLTQFSTEIDISEPEGMYIPAHQRFSQVQQLLQVWTAKYEHAASMLNVGLNRMDVVELRRVSRLTNRLVPQFETQEVDDPTPPRRSFPPIPEKSIEQRDGSEDTGMVTTEYGLGTDWVSLGTSGG